MTYDDWKLATPPSYEQPEEWETSKCKDCEYYQKLRRHIELCLSDPILADKPEAVLIHGENQACEVFVRRAE